MGVIFTTRGWTGAEIDVSDGGLGIETYVVSGDGNNAYDVAGALATWIADPARGWAADLTTLDWGVDYLDGDARVSFWYTSTGPFSMNFGANAVVAERINISASRGANEGFGTTRGSCATIPGMVMCDRRSTESGARSRNTSWRMGHGLYAHRRPNVELGLSLLEAYAFTEAVRIAASPRTAYLYDEQSDSWALWTIGRHTLGSHTDADATKIAGTLEVIGGA